LVYEAIQDSAQQVEPSAAVTANSETFQDRKTDYYKSTSKEAHLHLRAVSPSALDLGITHVAESGARPHQSDDEN
jgi:hypothetical protein